MYIQIYETKKHEQFARHDVAFACIYGNRCRANKYVHNYKYFGFIKNLANIIIEYIRVLIGMHPREHCNCLNITVQRKRGENECNIRIKSCKTERIYNCLYKITVSPRTH